MEKISMDKTYRTRDGRPVRILCVDRKPESIKALTVVGLVQNSEGDEWVKVFDEYGTNFDDGTLDLVEYDPLAELKLDEPIWVRDTPEDDWNPRHFAFHRGGRVYCWPEGRTSWSAEYGSDGEREEPIGWSFWKSHRKIP